MQKFLHQFSGVASRLGDTSCCKYRLTSLSLSPSAAQPAVSPWIIVGGVAGGIVVLGILICICGAIIAGVCIHCSLMYRETCA